MALLKNKIIKVCGMRSADNIRAIENLPIDMMGFIFYAPSPRFVMDISPDILPKKIKRVGVFVNEKTDEVLCKKQQYSLDFLQLHGSESVEYCAQLKTKNCAVIKAFSIYQDFEFQTLSAYENICDYFLFDTKTPLIGGSGKMFDWNVLKNYHGKTPFLLSGGIALENTDSLLTFYHPKLAGYDLNSRFESMPAMKDVEKLKKFFEKITDLIFLHPKKYE